MVLKILLLTALLPLALGDTPANCTYEDIRGTWTFHLGKGGHDNSVDCSEFEEERTVKVTLSYPDLVRDDEGNEGFWTMIYNQGFEVVVNKRSYFAFSSFTMINKTAAVSHCDKTSNGWSHNLNEDDWACYYGTKELTTPDKMSKMTEGALDLDRKYVKNMDFVDEINSHTKLWKAVHYPELEGMTLRDRLRRAGGTSKIPLVFPKPAPVRPETKAFVSNMPESLDWRDVDSTSYVTPIRNQGQCGSCYSFASMAMLESRLLILSNHSTEVIFSPQEVVSCSELAQGCEGGFPYLIAGRYAQDFGVVEEKCYPYLGRDSKCKASSDMCARYYSTDYKYVGGYFGACNEDEMMMDLVTNGPVSVAFEVTADFEHYKSGIYHTTGLRDSFNPWQATNHAVLVVGYGVEEGVKYWTVKNSWGESWGEKGFFRIRRGTNELSIESMAVSAKPVLP